MIAALYVERAGPYAFRRDVDLWPIERDARGYEGPFPVVAHPPCERWGRYHHGGPSARERRVLGDDGGCFAAALSAVRIWGGVLEHPEASHAWGRYGIVKPPKSGGWIAADFCGGWTCCVEQGWYGHPARKATWLYVSGLLAEHLPELVWGPCPGKARLDQGFHSPAERAEWRAAGDIAPRKRLTRRECLLTPLPFAELLIEIARKAGEGRVAA
jgi:hypothetical protein